MRIEEMSDAHKLVVFVTGALGEFQKRGILTPGPWRLEPMGIHLFDQLHSSGYRPQIEAAVACTILTLSDGGPVDLRTVNAVMQYDTVMKFLNETDTDGVVADA